MRRILLLLTALLLLGAPLLAQDREPDVPGEEGPAGLPEDRPRIVRIRFEGNRRYSDEFLRQQIMSKAGDRLDNVLLQRDDRILREYFEAVTDIRTDPVDGGVAITFFVRDRRVVGKVILRGLSRVKESDIIPLLSTRTGRPLLTHALRADEELLTRMEKEQGYHFVEVRHYRKATNRPDVEDIVFEVITGRRVKVEEVIVEGASGIEGADLIKKSDIKNNARYKKMFLGLGKLAPTYFDDQTIDEDRRRMEFYYQREGWLDAKVVLVGVDFDASNTGARIHYRVEEGMRYTLRKFEVSYVPDGEPHENDKTFLSPAALRGMSVMQRGAPFRTEEMDESRRRIEERLWTRAYAESRVQVTWTPQPGKKTVDVRVTIDAREKIRVGRIRFVGNRYTRDNVLRRAFREGALPGEDLDIDALQAARVRLNALRYFSMVRFGRGQGWGLVSAGPDAPPDVRDVLVEVEETDTRNFTIGAGLSTDGGAFGQFSVTWRNFDISRHPDSIWEVFGQDAYRGAGQTFTISASPGTQFSTFEVSFTDPAINDSRWSLFASVASRIAVFDTWRQITDGIRLRAGRFLDKRRNYLFSLEWSLRQVIIENPASNAPVNALDVQGTTTLNGFRASFRRTRRMGADPFLNGHITRLTGDINGGVLGGQADLWKIFFEQSSGWRVFHQSKGGWHRIKLVLGVGMASAFGGTREVPIYERYFLGGRNLRGFEFREVGPRSNGSPTGGEFVARFSTQYTIPITSQEDSGFGLSINLFVDQGSLVEEASQISWDNWRIAAGFGVGVGFGGATQPPLIIDFGWPIRALPEDKRQIISIAFERNF